VKRGIVIALTLSTVQILGCATRPPHETTPSPTAPAPGVILARAFVDAALSMQGQPYRFGGAAPGGFDCSGLVAYAAKRVAILVPRTAHEQLKTGIAVPTAQVTPGDLVFMHFKRELHVGILTAPGQFLHAPSSGGRVRIDRLDAAPYAQGYFAARRITP
jgi:cell wall-associated NlpC family hydrolase